MSFLPSLNLIARIYLIKDVSEYRLVTDKLKDRLTMLLNKDRITSSKDTDKNIGALAKLLEMPMDIFCEVCMRVMSGSMQSFSQCL